MNKRPIKIKKENDECSLIPLVCLGGRFRDLLGVGVSTDSCMNLLVQLLHGLSINSFLQVLTEVSLKLLRLVFVQHLHVVGDMATIDVVPVDISIELLVFFVETSKSLVTVRDIKPSVQGTLQ